MDIPVPSGPDVSIALRMQVSCWIMYGIALVILCMRLLAKLRISARLAIDDGLMVLSMICGIIYFSFATVGVTYGLGRHFYYLTPFERVNAMKFQFIGEPPGILCPMFGRLSFCFYLLNLIGPSKPRRWFLYGVMTQHFIINILTIILIVVQCPNFATMWDPVGHPGVCWSQAVQADFGYFQGATNAVTDIILTVMPAIIVWKLQIARNLKIGLTFLLGLSCFAVVGEIIRTRLTALIADRSDFTYNVIDFMIWCSVENCIVIIASSVPMLRSLFIHQKPSKSSYEMHSHDYPSRGATKASGMKSEITSRGYSGAESSEENILPLQGKDTIAKSTSYTVAYEITPDSKG